MLQFPVELWVALVSLAAGGAITLAGAVLQRRYQAAAELERSLRWYGDPLLRAASDLEFRVRNIVQGGFLWYLRGDERQRAYAERSTLWIIAQYFACAEVLRGEVHFLNMGSNKRSRALQEVLLRSQEAWATDRTGKPLMVYRADQRAIGELMITERQTDRGRRTNSLGYAAFCQRLEEAAFAHWFAELRADLSEAAAADDPGEFAAPRLVEVQKALVELINLLDPDAKLLPTERAALRST